jgi:hypothetical protein
LSIGNAFLLLFGVEICQISEGKVSKKFPAEMDIHEIDPLSFNFSVETSGGLAHSRDRIRNQSSGWETFRAM